MTSTARSSRGGPGGWGGLLWRLGDVRVIDGWLVNGSARAVGRIASVIRHVQTGLLYHYAFAMIIGLLALMTWLLYGGPGGGEGG